MPGLGQGAARASSSHALRGCTEGGVGNDRRGPPGLCADPRLRTLRSRDPGTASPEFCLAAFSGLTCKREVSRTTYRCRCCSLSNNSGTVTTSFTHRLSDVRAGPGASPREQPLYVPQGPRPDRVAVLFGEDGQVKHFS